MLESISDSSVVQSSKLPPPSHPFVGCIEFNLWCSFYVRASSSVIFRCHPCLVHIGFRLFIFSIAYVIYVYLYTFGSPISKYERRLKTHLYQSLVYQSHVFTQLCSVSVVANSHGTSTLELLIKVWAGRSASR